MKQLLIEMSRSSGHCLGFTSEDLTLLSDDSLVVLHAFHFIGGFKLDLIGILIFIYI